MDNESIVPQTEAGEREKKLPLMREGGGVFLLCAALTGAARPLCFCGAEGRGLNTVVFTVVWLLCTVLCLRRLKLWSMKKGAVYAAGMILLALSAFMTMNEFVQTVNGVGILLLMSMLLLSSFCQTETWQFGKYLKSVILLATGGLERLFDPMVHLWSCFRRGGGRDGKLRYVIAGLVISVPLAAIVMLFLSEADVIFRRLLDDLFRNLDRFDVPVTVANGAAGFMLVFFAFYCVIAGQVNKPVSSQVKPVRAGQPAVAITFMGVLALIYLVFCAIQVIYLFGGHRLPEGYTYSSYARQGFFELVFVSALNLLLVNFCTYKFGRGRALKILLTLISACTYVMLVSSAYRMILYVQVYGMSFLRILVLWFLLVLSIVLGGITVYIYKKDFNLFRFTFFVCLVLWICFAFARADRIAAKYNAEYIGINDDIAIAMMYHLSEDAVPVMTRYGYKGGLEKQWQEKLEQVTETNRRHGVRGFNLSLWEAARSVP